MNKYHARVTWLPDPLTGTPLRFDSAAEARRNGELCLLLRAGAIADLRRQVAYPCAVNGVLVCRYVADFVYVTDGQTVVEDTKSAATRKLPVYRLKKKLVKALYGVDIVEGTA